MDNKKILWITMSAGVFLLVVFGTATAVFASASKKNVSAVTLKNTDAIWVAPSANKPYVDKTPEVAGTPAADNGIDSIGGTYTPNASSAVAATGTKPATGKTADTIKTDSTTINLTNSGSANSNGVTVIAQGPTNIYGTNGEITLNMLKGDSSNAIASVTPQNSKTEQEIKETQNKKRVEETSSQKPKASATPAASKPAPATTPKNQNTDTPKTTTPKPTTATTAVQHWYWIQVGSYKEQNNANNARSVLEDNGLPCEVFTYDAKDGSQYYRVRVGPYGTKTEAEHIQKKIQTVAMFAKSTTTIFDSGAKAH